MIAKHAITTVAFLAWMAASTSAETRQMSPEIRQLLNQAAPVVEGQQGPGQPPEQPRVRLDARGYVRFLGAPPKWHFPNEIAQPVAADVGAYTFLKSHAAVFGTGSPSVDFAVLSNRSSGQRTHVKFQQVYAGIPVFAGQVIVQLNQDQGVECVVNDILTDTADLDSGAIAVTPKITPAQAETDARAVLATDKIKIDATPPALVIYAPSVIGDPGNTRLAWELRLSDANGFFIGYDAFVDALDGSLLAAFPLSEDALTRNIYDCHNTVFDPGTLVRSEGQGPVCSGGTPPPSCPQPDDAYLLMGDAYNYFWNRYGRDSVDDGGYALNTSIRYCQFLYPCPFQNAFWSFTALAFFIGDGFVVDDVICHEYTHGVTQYSSGLVYHGEPGAINESLSDIFGEFIDQTNGRGDDSAGVRWLIGEDLSIGAGRDMREPGNYGDPDRMGSPYWYTDDVDNSTFVHTNSGVGNKLAFLLTDGQMFNGQVVNGMGHDAVSNLFYHVETAILTSGASYIDLYDSLVQAASDLSWSANDRINLYHACLAVEIVGGIYVDGAYSGSQNGTVRLPFNTIEAGLNVASEGDTLIVRAGTYPTQEPLTIDTPMTIEAITGPVTIQVSP